MNRLLPLTLSVVLAAATQIGAQPVSNAAGAATLSATLNSQTQTRSGDKPMSQAIPAVASEETFDGTWPFRACYTDAAGFRMHYIDEGSGPETLLLLHGEPTWSYLFRQQIPIWAARHRRRPHGIRQERRASGPDLLAPGPYRQSRTLRA